MIHNLAQQGTQMHPGIFTAMKCNAKWVTCCAVKWWNNPLLLQSDSTWLYNMLLPYSHLLRQGSGWLTSVYWASQMTPYSLFSALLWTRALQCTMCNRMLLWMHCRTTNQLSSVSNEERNFDPAVKINTCCCCCINTKRRRCGDWCIITKRGRVWWLVYKY